MGAMAALGFWPCGAGPAASRMPPHPMLHVHAAIDTGWMVLLRVLAFARLAVMETGTWCRRGRSMLAPMLAA